MTQEKLSLVSEPETFQPLQSTEVLFSKSAFKGTVSFQCLFTCVYIWMDTIYLGKGSWKLSELGHPRKQQCLQQVKKMLP